MIILAEEKFWPGQYFIKTQNEKLGSPIYKKLKSGCNFECCPFFPDKILSACSLSNSKYIESHLLCDYIFCENLQTSSKTVSVCKIPKIKY